MVRFYKRKTTRGSYGLANIEAAISRVRNGELSKKRAEAIYGVPRRTIFRHLKGIVKNPGKLGRFGLVLGEVFEAALVDHAVNLQQSLFGLTTTGIRKLAFDIAEQNNLKHPFHNEKAGRGWLFGFMNRHPELSLRMLEPTSLARAVGFNKPSVDKFFNLYKNILSKESYTAQQIYNMDETSLTNVHKPGKVISKRGQRQVGKITSGEKGQTMTVICAVNAAGSYVPLC